MITHTLEVAPGFPPINANDRLHWHTRSERVKAWRQLAFAAATKQHVPAMKKARVTVTVSFPDNRRRDVHNLYPTAKALIDGLIDAGVLPDDDDKHLTGPDMRRGPKCGGPVLWRIDITEESR